MAPQKQKLMIPGSINAAQIPELQRWLESDVLSEKAKQRLRCILYFFEHNASLEETAKQFSTTPNSVRRWIATFDVTNPASLEEKSRRRIWIIRRHHREAVATVVCCDCRSKLFRFHLSSLGNGASYQWASTQDE
jgi:hypothetical protein